MLEWGLGSVADKVELVVSELATNALRVSTYPDGRPRYEAGAGLPFLGLRLSSDRRRVLIEVWDSSPHSPVPKTADPDEETGRGLVLVESVCEQWGWDEPSSRGKVVWCLVTTGE
jgi:two-component sensor histidine kinase